MKKVIAMLLVLLMMSAPTISLGAPTNIIYNIINKEEKTTNNKKDAMEMLYSFKKKSAEAKEEKEIKPKDVKIIKNEKELDEVKEKKEKIQGTLIQYNIEYLLKYISNDTYKKIINYNLTNVYFDVSKWNGDIDWAQVKEAGIQFVVIRAGYGYTIDKKFKRNIEGAIENNIHIGIYWFSYARTTDMAIEEARVCANVIEPYKDKIDLPVFFDFEYDSVVCARRHGVSISRTLATDMADAFCTTIKDYGYEAGIYTNLDFSNNYFTQSVLERWKVWIAQWTKTNTYKKTDYVMWQYSSRGYVKGIDGHVDMNYYYGDKDDNKN